MFLGKRIVVVVISCRAMCRYAIGSHERLIPGKAQTGT